MADGRNFVNSLEEQSILFSGCRRSSALFHKAPPNLSPLTRRPFFAILKHHLYLGQGPADAIPLLMSYTGGETV